MTLFWSTLLLMGAAVVLLPVTAAAVLNKV